MSSAASTPIESSPASTGSPVPPSVDAAQLERVLFEVKRVIVGQDRLVERMLVCLLARGHCLLEGVPGLAKTLAVETLAARGRRHVRPPAVHARPRARRHRRHPHLPAGQERFDIELGPVFANFVLADEINRAPAKVQSALLEVMAERQVSIGGVTLPVPEPFLVLATQNPIESEGVYPLPEAQRDRFLMKIVVDYPTPAEEREIVYRMGVEPPGRRDRCSAPTSCAGCSSDGRRRSSCTTRSSTTSVRLVLATRTPARARHGRRRARGCPTAPARAPASA